MEIVEAFFAPVSPDLIWIASIQQVMMLVAWIIGLAVCRGSKDCMMMPAASVTLTGLAGLWEGLLLVGRIFDPGDLWEPGMIGFVAMIAALVVVIVAVVLARLNPLPDLSPVSEIAIMEESETREFKSLVCWSLHTGKRDEEMGTIIVKTASALLSPGGGTLLIGVDDEGELIGLENDYSILKSPDADRFELWMRGTWG